MVSVDVKPHVSFLWPFKASSRGDRDLSASASFLAWGSSDKSLQRQDPQ